MDLAAPTQEARIKTRSAPARWIKPSIIGLHVLYMYGGILAALALDWSILPNESQGMLIPPLALYIAWARRDATLSCPAVPDGAGLFLIAASCLTFMVGKVGAEFFLARISFIMLLAGIAWTFWGRARLRTLLLPLVLMATMVPLPDIIYSSLTTPLQLLASRLATDAAQAFGISAYRDGNVIHLANISLGVEEACSGMHSLSALIVGGILLAFLNCRDHVSRALVILSALPIAIAMNVVRVTGTAVLADSHREFAVGFYHSFSGWLVFLLSIGILHLTSTILHRTIDRRGDEQHA